MATSKITGRTFGSATVEYGEDERGYLIAYAEGTAGRIFAASRSDNVLGFAARFATFGEGTTGQRIGYGSTQAAAVLEFATFEAEETIQRHRDNDELSEEQAERLWDRLGHVSMISDPEYRIAEVRNISHLASQLARVSR